MDTGLRLIEERRINEQTIAAFDIQPNSTGWLYPVPGGGQRWKANNSHSQPKYRWVPDKPEYAKLYYAPGLPAAIQKTNGICWYVSGEADVWAMHSAGIEHVISGFGESHVVPDLGSILGGFGVNTVYIAPDLDETGVRWAKKVSERLWGSGIHLEALQLPETLGRKGDVGKAWQEYQGTIPFEQWLANLPKLNIKSEPELPAASTELNNEVVPASYKKLVAKLLGVESFRSNGNSLSNVNCPFHDDKVPSATLHQEKGLYCHTCGRLYLWREIGLLLGIGSIREWCLSHRQVPPQQLSTETREALIRKKLTTVARVYDALIHAGWKPGREFTIMEAAQVCEPFGISIGTIYKITNEAEQTYSPFFPTTIVLNKKGERTAKKCRPRRVYRLLSPTEIGLFVGVRESQWQHYDSISLEKLGNAAEYRSEVHAALIRRRPGEYPRKFLAERLGVTPRTTRNYDKLADIDVEPRFKKVNLTDEEATNLPDERRNVPGNVWLEDTNGKKYQPTKSGAERAFMRSEEVYLVEQLANYYGPK